MTRLKSCLLLAALMCVSSEALADEIKASEQKCVTDDVGFREKDGANVFAVTLTNACEKRQRCVVNVYIVGARGPQQGRATLTLAAQSKGDAAQQCYVMKTPEAGGMANVSRHCADVADRGPWREAFARMLERARAFIQSFGWIG